MTNARDQSSIGGESPCECPTAAAFGFACGPAPLVDHGTIAPGRWRSPDTFVPWKVVGDDYPYKAAFNQPGREALDQPAVGTFKQKSRKAPGRDKAGKGKARGDKAFQRPKRNAPGQP